MSKDTILSSRMLSIFPLNKKSDECDNYLEKRVKPSVYDEHKNPEGVINFGIAWAYICDDTVNAKLATIKLDTAQICGTYYGTLSFRKSLAAFYSRKLRPKQPLDPENLIVTNGLTSTMDFLAHIIADRGEYFCTPTPTYAYFSRNFFLRSGVGLWPIDLFDASVELEKNQFKLTAEKVEDGIKKALEQDKVIRGLVISNPNNPLGVAYPEDLVLELLDICAKYQIHAIIDECSNLCMHEEGLKFKSVVAYDHIPDPDRTHVLWTATKDLSLGGARISTVYSYNPEVTNCFKIYSPFYATPTFSQKVCQEIVDDQTWCDEVYFPKFLHRMNECYKMFEHRLNKLGAFVYPVDGGPVCLVSFRKFLKDDTFEGEINLSNIFIKYGVYLTPGQFISCSQPGWFRIAFAFPKSTVEIGLERIEKALSECNYVAEQRTILPSYCPSKL